MLCIQLWKKSLLRWGKTYVCFAAYDGIKAFKFQTLEQINEKFENVRIYKKFKVKNDQMELKKRNKINISQYLSMKSFNYSSKSKHDNSFTLHSLYTHRELLSLQKIHTVLERIVCEV